MQEGLGWGAPSANDTTRQAVQRGARGCGAGRGPGARLCLCSPNACSCAGGAVDCAVRGLAFCSWRSVRRCAARFSREGKLSPVCRQDLDR